MKPFTRERAGRRAARLLPFLLCAGLAACGGDWRVEFDGGHDHRDHDRPGPTRETGLFLIAGDLCGCEGTIDGRGSAARFSDPAGVAEAADGNLYVAERGSSTIRKVTPQGVATTLAGAAGATGSTDGVGNAARFTNPARLDADRAGNVYVTDGGNSTIRKITSAGVVTTLAGSAGVCGSADGSGALAQFCHPQGIAVDRSGNLFVTDTLNHTVRKIDPAGRVSTVAGSPGACGSADGRGAAARFCQPQDITVDSAGYLYVADTANSTIRQISPSGDVTTLAGAAGQCASADGNGAAARFCLADGIKLDDFGNLYVADSGNATVRVISRSNRVSTVAGVAGQGGVVLGPLPGGLAKSIGIAVTRENIVALTSGNLVMKLVPTP